MGAHVEGGRSLGSYEEDSLKAHVHDATHGHSSPAHSHYMDHIHGMWHVHNFAFSGGLNGICGLLNGALNYSGVFVFQDVDNAKLRWAGEEIQGRRLNIQMNVNQNTGGVIGGPNGNYTTDTAISINNFTGNTGATGGTETRMKNIAVQFYVIAKVLV